MASAPNAMQSFFMSISLLSLGAAAPPVLVERISS
jgi:hypothetical protein